MASLLRQIVASPRIRHPEANLDLCYATDNIIVTSGPSDSYPKVAYRNPLKSLVAFLDQKHKDKWAIWEFRAEGTGYPDSEVYGRIKHYPYPDHHAPPFALIPLIMASMRNWLKTDGVEGRVAVIHCKAGKGRSGTATCSYLISEEGWTPEDAMQRFTERRMRPGFGPGISIPSQRRTISYVDRWTRHGKRYIERPAEVVEIHIWGLKDGVKIAVQGFAEEGKRIQTFHTFTKAQRQLVRGEVKDSGFSDIAMEMLGRKREAASTTSSIKSLQTSDDESAKESRLDATRTSGTGDIIYKPDQPIRVPSSDICIDVVRRSHSKLAGITMVTAVAHVWFNVFFEGRGPEQDGQADDSGVFEIDWDALDGLKGSSRKGTKAFDKMAVVWRASHEGEQEIRQPEPHEEVKQTQPADWRKVEDDEDDPDKGVGIRREDHESEVADASNETPQGRHEEPLGEQIASEPPGKQPSIS